MKKLQNFFKTIPSAIYSPELYSKVSKQKFFSSVWYLFFLMLLAHTIMVLVPLLAHSGEIVSSLKDFKLDDFIDYPDELVITIEDGVLSTNVKEPYYIGSNFISEEETEVLFTNFIVIDTQAQFSSEQFSSYDSWIWISSDTVFIASSDGRLRTAPLNQIPDSLIDKEAAEVITDLWFKTIVIASAILVLPLFVFLTFCLLIWRLVYALLLAAITWLISKVIRIKKLSFEDAYKMSLYGMTFSILLSVLVWFATIWTNISSFLFMFTVFTILVLTVNLYQAKKKKLIK